MSSGWTLLSTSRKSILRPSRCFLTGRFTRDTGVRLYDIRFKGERILYELGLQEAIAHYAGQDPVQSGIAYIDSYYGFGPYAFNLVPGYDIPEYAQCLEGWVHQDETMTVSGDCVTAMTRVRADFRTMNAQWPYSRWTRIIRYKDIRIMIMSPQQRYIEIDYVR